MKIILVLENGKLISNKIRDKIRNKEFELVDPETFYNLAALPGIVPNLVIADLTSIKKEKVELLMNLKAHPILSMIPYLLIIKEHSNNFKAQLSLSNYYLEKPLRKNELMREIDKILTNSDITSPW